MKVLLVDDHLMLSNGVKQFLAQRPEIEIVGQSSTAAAALTDVQQLAPDLVIMDVHLPDSDGITLAEEVTRRYPSTNVLIYSGDGDRSMLDRALRAGVRGYVLKTSPVEELLQAIEAAKEQRLYVCSELNAQLLEDYCKELGQPGHELSARELQLIQLIARGIRTKEMAQELETTVKAIETSRARLMRKLGCKSVAELVRYAIREGIVTA